MGPDFLSEVELYYTDHPVGGNKIIIDGDECHHMTDVMRHKVGDIVYVTDGKGNIYRAEILTVDKKIIAASVKDSVFYDNPFKNLVFCLPRLKSADRFEYALEKCVELGISNFIVFESKRTVA
ncbi:MAG: RsmE family RNA methyltransferase, partial [Melioribacteraceae bacterium]